jgi:hypothetical protein
VRIPRTPLTQVDLEGGEDRPCGFLLPHPVQLLVAVREAATVVAVVVLLVLRPVSYVSGDGGLGDQVSDESDKVNGHWEPPG